MRFTWEKPSTYLMFPPGKFPKIFTWSTGAWERHEFGRLSGVWQAGHFWTLGGSHSDAADSRRLKKGVESSSFWVNLGQDLRAIELVGTDYSGLFRNLVDSKLRFKSIGHHDETFAIVAKVECRMSFHKLCLWICMDCDNVYVESIDTWFMPRTNNKSCSSCPCSYPTLDSLDTVCPG